MKSKKNRIENIIRIVYRYWKANLPKLRESCPNKETLVCFVDGLLNKTEKEKVMRHLLNCNMCLEKVIISIRIS